MVHCLPRFPPELTPTPSPAPAPLPVTEVLSWQQQACRRFSTLWPLKAGGTVIFMLLFFWGYFGVLQHPGGSVTVMPLTVMGRPARSDSSSLMRTPEPPTTGAMAASARWYSASRSGT